MRGVVLCLLLACLCRPALASAETMRLVTGDDYAPFTGQQLSGGGLLTQVVQAALAQVEVKTELEWHPWNRGMQMTLKAEYDATFPYVYTAERGHDYLYSEPLAVIEQHLFSRAGEVYEVSNLAALTGKRLCYPLGWQLPAALDQMIEQGLLTRHSPIGLPQCARLLLLNRDDVFVADSMIGAGALSQADASPGQFQRSQSTFPSTSLHLLVSRQHPQAEQLIAVFNRGLALLRENKQYEQLVINYLNGQTEQ